MNGRNKRKNIRVAPCYGKEPWFKRSLVSPLCIYILSQRRKNARWDVVQSARKHLVKNEETGKNV